MLIYVETAESSEYRSDAEKVREFTFEAGQTTPDKPIGAMSIDEVNFISKMIIDEVSNKIDLKYPILFILIYLAFGIIFDCITTSGSKKYNEKIN